jgi:hypothetical protein
MRRPSQEATPGDILFAKNNYNKGRVPSHYMVYLGPSKQNDLFEGAMITHSPSFGNVPLTAAHFETTDGNGNPWKVQFDDTHMVNQLFHKKEDWHPFTKVGQLTPAGLQFVRTQLGGQRPAFSPWNKD